MSSKLPDAKPETAELNRRDFLKRVGYASALTLATGGLGLALYDPKGPVPSRGPEGVDRFRELLPPRHGSGAGENGHSPGHGPGAHGRAGGKGPGRD